MLFRSQLQSSHGPLIQGVLDKNGRAEHDGIGPGPVNIVYSPYVDTEKQIILKEIKRVMDEFITQEREEKARITEQTKNETDLQEDWEFIKSISRAGYTVAVSAAEFFNYVVWGAAKEGFHLIQYLTPITAPAAFEKDVARFKNTYKVLKQFTDEDLKILYTVMEDPESRQLFTQFASDYLDAQHGLEITEGTAEVVFSVILAFTTASGGVAVAAGHGGEKLAELGSKLADPIQRLMVIIKQALAKKRVKGVSNRLVESSSIIGDNNVPVKVIRSDNDFNSKINHKGRAKSYIDEEGTLRPANIDGDATIQQHVRGGHNKDNSPYTSTTDPDFAGAPKNFGDNTVKIDTKRLQKDIDTGKVKGTEIIPPKKVQAELYNKIDEAQKRYNDNPTKKNMRTLKKC